MNQSAIITTCNAVKEDLPLVDMTAEIFKSQWWVFLMCFIFISVIVMYLLLRTLKGTTKISTVRQNIIIYFLLSQLISVISYVIILSSDFQFIKDFINSIK